MEEVLRVAVTKLAAEYIGRRKAAVAQRGGGGVGSKGCGGDSERPMRHCGTRWRRQYGEDDQDSRRGGRGSSSGKGGKRERGGGPSGTGRCLSGRMNLEWSGAGCSGVRRDRGRGEGWSQG